MYKLKIKLKNLPKKSQEKKLHQDAMKCCTILIYQKLHFEVFGVIDKANIFLIKKKKKINQSNKSNFNLVTPLFKISLRLEL